MMKLEKEQHVQVHSALGRDVAPGQLGKMIEKLNTWTSTAETLIQHMDEEIETTMNKWNEKERKKKSFEKQFHQAHILALKQKEVEDLSASTSFQEGSSNMDFYVEGGNRLGFSSSGSSSSSRSSRMGNGSRVGGSRTK